jgi:alpha-beta hydrolase superfamily lysophospholipase
MRTPFHRITNHKTLTFALVATFLFCAGHLTVCEAKEPQPVDFKATDGVPLRGYLFGSGSSAVILTHMYPADQKSWFPLARKLAEKGYLAMTFDCRGYGESGGSKVVAEIDRDLEGAYRLLRPKTKKIFLMGASMGGTASIRVAARSRTAGVVSLSAPMAFKGLDAREAIGKIEVPCLFVSAEGDGYAYAAAHEFYKAAKSPKRQLLIVPGPEHGTRLFSSPSGEKVEKAIFDFLETN